MPHSFENPQTILCQAPLSMGFPSQKYRSGLPFPSPGDLSNPKIEPASLALTGTFFTTAPQWSLFREHVQLETVGSDFNSPLLSALPFSLLMHLSTQSSNDLTPRLWDHSLISLLFIYLFYLTVPKLSCFMWDLVTWPGIELGHAALGAWSLSHWTTREVSWLLFLELAPKRRGIFLSSTPTRWLLVFWVPGSC